MFENVIESVLIPKEQLDKRVKELAQTLSRDYEGKTPLLVCILKGSVMFYTDLIRYMTTNMTLDFMSISSYGSGSKSSGEVKIIKDLDSKIEGRDVIIIEDIIDMGYTLSYLVKLLQARNPKSIKLCALLDKKARREVQVDIDYKGFDIGDEFVVGYGLDYDSLYRNIPEICILKREVYEKN